MKAYDIIKALKCKGWYLRRVTGSHYHFKHEQILGLVTVPYHANEDLKLATLQNIMKMAQLSESDFFNKKQKKIMSHKTSGVMNAITNSY
jgi:predicted RNA binding protein YcfA (HicA-like mRNA interferase family)